MTDSIRLLLQESSSSSPSVKLSLGPLPQALPSSSNPSFVPKHEASLYSQILEHAFLDVNDPTLFANLRRVLAVVVLAFNPLSRVQISGILLTLPLGLVRTPLS
jgi:hypothetical protein